MQGKRPRLWWQKGDSFAGQSSAAIRAAYRPLGDLNLSKVDFAGSFSRLIQAETRRLSSELATQSTIKGAIPDPSARATYHQVLAGLLLDQYTRCPRCFFRLLVENFSHCVFIAGRMNASLLGSNPKNKSK